MTRQALCSHKTVVVHRHVSGLRDVRWASDAGGGAWMVRSRHRRRLAGPRMIRVDQGAIWRGNTDWRGMPLGVDDEWTILISCNKGK
jgi:hypothetical protein